MPHRTRRIKKKHKKSFDKNPNTKDNNVTFYNKYKGTKLIPTTDIIEYVKSNYNDFVNVKKDADEKGKNALYMDDCFNFEDKLNSGKAKKFSIDTSVESNPNMSLHKLIAYSFYLKMKYIFTTQNGSLTTMDDFLDKIKYQIGKDVKTIAQLIILLTMLNIFLSKMKTTKKSPIIIPLLILFIN